MDSVALRFSDNFAPEPGTILLHQELIKRNGHVWYGKMDRYWAYIKEIQREEPPKEEIPEYYRDKASQIKTWFKVYKIETAEKNVMKKCRVKSSGAVLSEAAVKSMSPFFMIEVDDIEEL